MSPIKDRFFRDGEAPKLRAETQESNPHQSERKRAWPILLALLFLAASAAQAQYSVTISGGAVTINSYTGSGGAVAIPATISNLPVTTIGSEAFYGLTNITSVTMPDTVTSIQNGAFQDCSLASITLSTNLNAILDVAFSMCGLTNINIPGSVIDIGLGVFAGSTNLAAINVDPQNFVYSSVGGVLFNHDQTTLVDYPGTGGSYTIPITVTDIGVEAFLNSSLTNVTIPTNVTSIEDQAFAGASLASLNILASVTNFGDYAFSNCPVLGSATIASPIVGQDAFYDCSALTNLTLAVGVTNIGENAFNLCTSLTNVTIPHSVASIGEDAFVQCSSLASVIISPGVASIGVGAFYNCVSLSAIAIPFSVTNIGLEAFLGCTSLTAITVNPVNLFYSSTNGVLFNKNQTTLIAAPSAINGNYAVPVGVTSVETYAFFSCTSLTNVTIPASVTNIADHAFYYCPGLTSVFFAGNPPFLGPYVFLSDNDATVYYLPDATGWSFPFGGLPGVLWNPLIQSTGASFGFTNNEFGFNVTGTTNIPIVVETCTNLASGVWTPLQTLTLTKGLFYFSQRAQTNDDSLHLFRISSP
jgi:phage tail sheath protein FI